jgi:WD40 repeat protein
MHPALLRQWDAASGQAIVALEGHAGPVFRANFSPDWTHIVTASYDNSARLWDAASGRTIIIPNGHTAPVNFADFGSDGTRIVTASEDKTAGVWDGGKRARRRVSQGARESNRSRDPASCC